MNQRLSKRNQFKATNPMDGWTKQLENTKRAIAKVEAAKRSEAAKTSSSNVALAKKEAQAREAIAKRESARRAQVVRQMTAKNPEMARMRKFYQEQARSAKRTSKAGDSWRDPDRQRNVAILEGIKGKLYRKDGSYIDVSAEKGEAALNKNDFSLEGKVVAILNSGGEFYADKISWKQQGDKIIAVGHVKLIKDAYTVTADAAYSTSTFQQVKLKGNAKVTKGGE